MGQITREAHAKLNLSLDITGRRADGYHEVRMVMQSVGLCDRVTVRMRTAGGIRLTCSDALLPVDEQNLAYRAAQLFRERFGADVCCDIHIEKHIPVAAGLAGGSTDAAAVLHALNELYRVGASLATLQNMGLELGADVPYCLYGRPALAEGIGERLTPVRGLEGVEVLIVNPGFAVSTAAVYGEADNRMDMRHPNTGALIDALSKGDVGQAVSHMNNVMQPVTDELYGGRVETLIAPLRQAGALHAMMSGSGPTVFGLFPAGTQLDILVRSFTQQGMFACRTGLIP